MTTLNRWNVMYLSDIKSYNHPTAIYNHPTTMTSLYRWNNFTQSSKLSIIFKN